LTVPNIAAYLYIHHLCVIISHYSWYASIFNFDLWSHKFYQSIQKKDKIAQRFSASRVNFVESALRTFLCLSSNPCYICVTYLPTCAVFPLLSAILSTTSTKQSGAEHTTKKLSQRRRGRETKRVPPLFWTKKIVFEWIFSKVKCKQRNLSCDSERKCKISFIVFWKKFLVLV
jgi:hypothetical protein